MKTRAVGTAALVVAMVWAFSGCGGAAFEAELFGDGGTSPAADAAADEGGAAADVGADAPAAAVDAGGELEAPAAPPLCCVSAHAPPGQCGEGRGYLCEPQGGAAYACEPAAGCQVGTPCQYSYQDDAGGFENVLDGHAEPCP